MCDGDGGTVDGDAREVNAHARDGERDVNHVHEQLLHGDAQEERAERREAYDGVGESGEEADGQGQRECCATDDDGV